MKKIKIGIPKAFLYYRYHILWEEFFKNLNCEIITSNDTTEKTLELGKNTTAEEINAAIKAAQNETLQYTEDPIVSSDVIGRRCGSLVDGLSTTVLDVDGKQLVKVVSWYDNEMSYTAQMVRTANYLMNK